MGRRIRNALSSLRFWHREVIPYVPRPWQTGGLLSLPDDILLYILDKAYPDDTNSRITLAMRLADVHPSFRLKFSRMFRHCVSPRGENWGSVVDTARAVVQYFEELLYQPTTFSKKAIRARTRIQIRAVRLFHDYCACVFYLRTWFNGLYVVPGFEQRYLTSSLYLEVFLTPLPSDLSTVHVHGEAMTAFINGNQHRPYIELPDDRTEGTL
jgi:hypothetical protein